MTKKKAPEDLLKAGRPSLYKPEHCDMVLDLGKQGKSMTQMAAHFDVDKETVKNWTRDYPEFLAAFTRAMTFSQAWWEDQGQAGLASRDFNAPLWHKNVASRFREDYTDRKEVTGANGGPVAVASVDLRGLSDAELATMQTLLGKATEGK